MARRTPTGWTVRRGDDYSSHPAGAGWPHTGDSIDDCIARWYADRDGEPLDHSGPGHLTRREAIDALIERLDAIAFSMSERLYWTAGSRLADMDAAAASAWLATWAPPPIPSPSSEGSPMTAQRLAHPGRVPRPPGGRVEAAHPLAEGSGGRLNEGRPRLFVAHRRKGRAAP